LAIELSGTAAWTTAATVSFRLDLAQRAAQVVRVTTLFGGRLSFASDGVAGRPWKFETSFSPETFACA